MRCPIIVALLLLVLPGSAAPSAQSDLPSVLTCTANAKAVRDYAFLVENGWSGGANSKEVFGIGTARTTNGLTLRDKVFSGLNTSRPTVRSITPGNATEGEDAAEFVASVESRAFDSVWISWKNPPGNKVWLSVINLKNKKAIVTQLFEGVTSVGGEIETLDCR